MADYATLLRDLVTLTCRSVDRIFLQAYVPKLQSMGEVCQFLHWQKGFGIPSSAAFGTIAITAITRGSPKRSAGACWPSMIDGRVTSVKVATSGAGRAWAARRVAQTLVGFSPTARRAFAIVGFTHLLAGFENPTLVRLVGTLLDRPYTSRQATYDLRRLKRKSLIIRLSGHHRYQLTPLGRRVAVLFTNTYGRVLAPGLAALDPRLPPELVRRRPLAIAWRQFDCALDDFITEALTTA